MSTTSSDLPSLTFLSLLAYVLASVALMVLSLTAGLVFWLVSPVALLGLLALANRHKPDVPLTVEELVAVGVDWNHADSIRPG